MTQNHKSTWNFLKAVIVLVSVNLMGKVFKSAAACDHFICLRGFTLGKKLTSYFVLCVFRSQIKDLFCTLLVCERLHMMRK